MQEIVTLSSKGQIVIPKRVRDEIGLVAGDQLKLEWNGKSLEFRKITQKPVSKESVVQELLGKYKINNDTNDESEKDSENSIRNWRKTLYGKIND